MMAAELKTIKVPLGVLNTLNEIKWNEQARLKKKQAMWEIIQTLISTYKFQGARMEEKRKQEEFEKGNRVT